MPLAPRAVIFVLTLAIPVQAYAEDPVAILRNGDVKARIDWSNKVLTERTALVRGLLEIVREPGPPPDVFDRRQMAISLLGKLRAKEASPLLAEQITLRFPMIVTEDMGEASGYPCAVALMEIGSRSLSAVIEQLKVSTDPKRTALLLWVLRLVDGRDVGTVRLQAAARAEMDSTRREGSKRQLCQSKRRSRNEWACAFHEWLGRRTRLGS